MQTRERHCAHCEGANAREAYSLSAAFLPFPFRRNVKNRGRHKDLERELSDLRGSSARYRVSSHRRHR